MFICLVDFYIVGHEVRTSMIFFAFECIPCTQIDTFAATNDYFSGDYFWRDNNEKQKYIPYEQLSDWWFAWCVVWSIFYGSKHASYVHFVPTYVSKTNKNNEIA